MNISETPTQNWARRSAVPGGKWWWSVFVFIFCCYGLPTIFAPAIGGTFGGMSGATSWVVLHGALLVAYSYGLGSAIRWQRLLNANGSDPDAW